MKFTYTIPLEGTREATWQAMQDSERLIRCLPGCESVEPAAAGEEAGGEGDGSEGETYQVVLKTGLGPVRLRMAGSARLRREAGRTALVADVNLKDRFAGSLYGTFTLEARARDAEKSEILLDADVVMGGKMGEFAQPILRRKADQTVKEFAGNLQRQLG